MLINTDRELIKELFFEACHLSEEKQAEYLHVKCSSNTELFNELNSLLKAYKKSTVFFGNLAQDILGVNLDCDEDEDEVDLNPDPYRIINTDINHYSILSKIGDGGMGVIYKAKDNKLNRIVALKFLPPFLTNDHQAIKRFRREAITASNIDHPNVGTIYSVEKTYLDQPFIVMAYYQGETLQDKLDKGNLSIELSLNMIHQVISGLEAAHQKNIVHRDIKPANIIIMQDGLVKILDFGLAKVCDDSLTRSGMKMGTLAYMSPEQIKGDELDSRSDIWSLGVLFYELLSGRRPFTGLSDQSLMYSVLNDEVNFSVIEASFSVKKAIRKCLRRQISKRYQSTRELLVDLNYEFTNKQSISQSKFSKILEQFLLTSKKKYLITGVSIVLIITVLTIYFSSSFIQSLTSNSNLTRTPILIQNKETNYKLPLTKSIAIYASQERLSNFQLGLVNNISEVFLSIAHDSNNIWIIPYSKIRKYQAFDYKLARKTFGVNLIVNLDLSYLNNKHLIQLDLIDATTLIPLKTVLVAQVSENMASLQESINTAILDILSLSGETNLRKKMFTKGTTDPDSFESYARALGLLQRPDQKNNVEQAMVLLQMALDKEPDFLAAKSKLADIYWLMYLEHKDIEYAKKSEKLYEILILKQQDDISSYLSLGKLHSTLKRYGTALASYKLALKFNNNSAEIFEGMARIYEKTEKLELAEEFYLKSIYAEPGRWDGFNDLGAFYLRQGRYSDSVKQFSQVVVLTPGNAWGFSNLGSAYWYLGQLDKAIENFELSLSLRENYKLYKNLATLYFYETNYQKAVELYTKASIMNANDHELFASLAGAYHHSGEPRDLVILTFKKAIVLALKKRKVLPNDIEINLSLASYYAWIGLEKLSKQYLKTIQDVSSLTVQHYSQIAVIYELLGNSKLAIDWFDKALKKGYPKDLLMKSPDIDALKENESFKQLISKY